MWDSRWLAANSALFFCHMSKATGGMLIISLRGHYRIAVFDDDGISVVDLR
jgi:hypothetical protein